MSGSSQVNLTDWKLKTVICGNQTTHSSANSSAGTWKRGEELGRGGFGEVWKETCHSIFSEKPRIRAVKRIWKTDKATQELPNLIKLSTKNYYGTDHLKHFVEFFGWYEDVEGGIRIAMEYIPNHDLQHHIQKRHEKVGSGKGFDEVESASIVVEISKALKFMHEKNIMHRDLKPANVLISAAEPNWQIKLADFGISKDTEHAAAQTKAGTDGYMAPEVADSNRTRPYTSSADIWSLGAITFCIQTGKPPFPDNIAVARYVDGRIGFPFKDMMELSGKLVVLIMQLMDVVPARRPTVDDVLQHPWVITGDDVPPDRR
ncbi:kinase-like domain-containing protein [Nemania serpens]|nr:kinase-like domain-containing protein [Nemania serpens]